MARDHARIKLRIWDDDDWRDLTGNAQHLYLVLLTHPTLSYCGVADWRPARLTGLVKDWDDDTLQAAADELMQRLYIIADSSTEEVLLRSFVRNDELMKQPKMASAMAAAYSRVASAALRGIVVHELIRLHEEQPELNGWKSEKARALLDRHPIDPSTYPCGKGSVYPSGKGSVYPSLYPSEKGSPTDTPNPSGKGSVKDPPTPYSLLPSPTPAPSTSDEVEKEPTTLSGKPDEPPGFAEFYAAYPRKEARGRAAKAWRTAVKRVSIETIMDALANHTFSPDRQYQPLPATWLNDQHWHDEKAAAPMYDVSRLPEPGTGWSREQLDMVLGKDTWEMPEPPAEMTEDDGYLWQQAERRRHFALRAQAALEATGRTA